MEQRVFYYNGQPVQWVNFDGVQTFVDGNDVFFNNVFNPNPMQFTATVKPPVIVDVEWHEVEEEPSEETVEPQPEETISETEEESEEEGEDGVCELPQT